MRVFAEFVGGPLDGELAFLSEAIREFRVPVSPLMQSLNYEYFVPPNLQPTELIYRAEQQLRRRAPTGERIWRFELVQT